MAVFRERNDYYQEQNACEQKDKELIFLRKFFPALHSLKQPFQFIQELHCAILGQGALLRILFPDNHNLMLADRLREGIREYLNRLYPDRTPSYQSEVVLSYMVYGSYCAYLLHQEKPEETLRLTAEISEMIQRKYQVQ